MSPPVVLIDVDVQNVTGFPSSGSVTVFPTVQVTDPNDGLTISTVPAVFPYTGVPLSIPVYATDYAGFSPAGFAWVMHAVPSIPSSVTFFAPAGPCAYTATDASPAVFSWTPTVAFTTAFSGTLPDGTGVALSAGAPTGFTPGNTYYVVGSTSGSFTLALERGGTPVASSSTGGGTFTVISYAYSGLVPLSAAPVLLQYMPATTGIPTAGQVPQFTGVGLATTPGSVGEAVASVFGRTGVVAAQSGDYTAAQVGADASGAAATAQSTAEAFATSAVGTETTRAEAAEALALQKSGNLSDVANAGTARTNLGLGSAATQASSAFDASGAAAAEASRAEAAEALLVPIVQSFALANNTYQTLQQFTVTGQTDDPLPPFGQIVASETYTRAGYGAIQGPATYTGYNVAKNLGGGSAAHGAIGTFCFADAGDTNDGAGGHGLEVGFFFLTPNSTGTNPITVVANDDNSNTVSVTFRCGTGTSNGIASGLSFQNADASKTYITMGPSTGNNVNIYQNINFTGAQFAQTTAANLNWTLISSAGNAVFNLKAQGANQVAQLNLISTVFYTQLILNGNPSSGNTNQVVFEHNSVMKWQFNENDTTFQFQSASAVQLTLTAGATSLLALSEFASRVKVDSSLIVGTAALATTATDGFVYVPTCAGPPTGVPTANTGTVPLIFDTTDTVLWAYSGGAWGQVTPLAPNVQMFTANGTWTKPAGAQIVRAYVTGGGSGGSSGGSGPSGTVVLGGAGGTGPVLMQREFVASDLAATEAVTIGAGGLGGASVTGLASARTDPTCGTTNAGTTVTDTAAVALDIGHSVTGTGIPANTTILSVTPGTSFVMSAAATATGSVTLTIGATTVGLVGKVGVSSVFGSSILLGAGASAPVAPQTSSASAWGPVGFSNNGSGVSASGTGGNGVGANGCQLPNGQGGVSGGGITTGAVAGAGSSGGVPYSNDTAVQATGGVVGGASPTSGTNSALVNGSFGPSPGSGAASVTGAAQAGANALANSAAGGSGGGASLNGNASGAGGNGGSGWVLVITLFQ